MTTHDYTAAVNYLMSVEKFGFQYPQNTECRQQDIILLKKPASC